MPGILSITQHTRIPEQEGCHIRIPPIFTIRLTNREDGITHPMKYKTDTGLVHVVISVCNEYHEVIRKDFL